jgi:hypothetical protein
LGGSGIYTGNGGANTTTTITDSDGTFLSFGAAPSINTGGTVAFRATRDAGGTGLYLTNGNGGFLLAIETGQAFMGSTVSSFNFSNQGLNDLGQLAFQASLADGRSGIYTAQVAAVPEPSTYAMMIIGLGAIAFVGWKRKRSETLQPCASAMAT